MKKLILVALVAVLYSTVVVGQSQSTLPYQYGGIGETSIGKVVVKSKVKLEYDSRTQKSDTIYVAIQNWSYSGTKDLFTAQIVDFVKEAGKFKKINAKTKSYTPAEVNAVFTAKANSILPTENYTSESVGFLNALLLANIKEIVSGTETIYSGVPLNWIVAPQ